MHEINGQIVADNGVRILPSDGVEVRRWKVREAQLRCVGIRYQLPVSGDCVIQLASQTSILIRVVFR